MPGTFAHIALAGYLCWSDQLDRVSELPNYIKAALGSYSKFCELGAVSPDYPYLALCDNEAKGWANVMHYWQTADFLRRGVVTLAPLVICSPLAPRSALRGFLGLHPTWSPT